MILLLFTTHPAFSLERFDVITTEDLATLMHQRDEGKAKFHLVNTLDVMVAQQNSIPGSINIPWSKVDELSHLLGNDKDYPIITYCMGYR